MGRFLRRGRLWLLGLVIGAGVLACSTAPVNTGETEVLLQRKLDEERARTRSTT